jgi:hypothetical protein
MADPLNPIDQYRRAQRRVRRLFAPFTAVHCATCVTPCCVKPTWVRPVDLILVEELGYGRPAALAGRSAVTLLDTLAGDEGADSGQPCEYLGGSGCAFPADLRPFGCAAAICAPMRRLLPAPELARLERAVEELTAAHTALMTLLHAPVEAEQLPLDTDPER